jgi:hypothetical protein
MQVRTFIVVAVALAACQGEQSGQAPSGPSASLPAFPPPSELVPPTEGSVDDASPPPLPPHLGLKTRILGEGEPKAIRLEFDRPMATFPGNKTATELGPDLAVALIPAHPLDARWASDRVLELSPANAWPEATEFVLRVARAAGKDGSSLTSPVESRFVVKPLRITTAPSTLAYPENFPEDGSFRIRSSHELKADALKRHLAITSHAGNDTSRPGHDEAYDVTPGVVPEELVITLKSKLKYAHVYAMRVSRELVGPGPAPLGEDWVTYLRGPEPLAVSSFYCGWPRCTPETSWTISFNRELDPRSLATCVETSPRLDLGPPKSEGWAAVYQPSGLKAGQRYTLKVSRCRDTQGEPMANVFSSDVTIEPPGPELAMVNGTGFLLPPAEGEPVSVKVRAAHTGKLTVSLARIERESLVPFLTKNLLTTELWSFGNFNVFDAETTKMLSPPDEGGLVDIGISEMLVGERGLIAVRVVSERVDQDGHAPTQGAVVQVTDLSLTAKVAPTTTLVWVTSLGARTPISDVDITLVDGKGASLWSGRSDTRGLAIAPGFTGQLAPRFIIASRGKEAAFLDLDEWQTRTDPYAFDLPVDWEPVARGLDGMVFTERGVYRAGETVHIKGFLRLDDGKRAQSLAGETAEVEAIDPLGDPVMRKTVQIGEVSDLEVDLPLGAGAALGNWSIRASVRAKSERALLATFRVEAYRPNTFEAKVEDLRHDLGSAAGGAESLTAVVSGRYYHGAPLVDVNVRWWLTTEEAPIAPAGFERYTFGVSSSDDAWWEPHGRSVATIGTGTTTLDAEGRAAVSAAIAGDATGAKAAVGPRRLTLEAAITDVDAQVVTGRSSLRVESSDHYLGVKTSTQFANIGENIDVQVAAVTAEGRPVAPAKASLRWIRRTWVTERKDAAGGGFEWVSSSREEILENRDIEVGPDAGRVATFSALQAGSYVIEAEGTDARGRIAKTRKSVWIWGGAASWESTDAGQVELIAERRVWKVGETARVVAQSPYEEAEALITVERNGVITEEVRHLSGSAPLIEIPVTEDMRPNAYVSVVLLGRPSNKGPEGEARMGYAELRVDDSDRRIAVSVRPDASEHRPRDKARVSLALADSEGRPVSGQVTFMAVDEGVLSLTGYSTPDPHAAVNASRPLAMTTFEGRRLLWRERTLEEVKSDWGGGGEGGEATNYRSAFATTAAFMPDVIVGSDGRAEVEFDLPDNLTTFRLMAIAATSDGRFGSGESKVVVNRPLTIRPGLPRFIAAGDTFDARAIVQTLDPELVAKGLALEVTLKVAGPLALEGPGTQTVKTAAAATPVGFRMKALAPGTGTFAFRVASPDGTEDAFELTLPIAWPAPLNKAWDQGVLTANARSEGRRIALPEWMHGEVGGLEMTISNSRMSELLPSLRYLLEYPYGCVEQTTSATLPLLALRALGQGVPLPDIDPAAVLERAQSGLDRLVSMQTWTGGLGYWPGDSSPHPWGSVYGGFAMVSASSIQGLAVPAEAIDSLKTYLKTILTGEAAAREDEWRKELEVVKPFAAWVLALAGAPDHSANAALFDRRSTLPDFGKLMLALAIVESKGNLAMASTLVDLVRPRITSEGDRAFLKRDGDRYYHSTMDSDVRNQAVLVLALERLAPEDPALTKLAHGLLASRQRGQWSSTQDNAFAVLALARHFARTEAHQTSSTVHVSLGETSLGDLTFAPGSPPQVLRVPMSTLRKSNGQPLRIDRPQGDGPVYWSARLDYASASLQHASATRGFSVVRTYEYAAGPRKGQLIGALEAGDLVAVTVELDTPNDRRYVAVDDPLPAGLEPVLLDFETTGSHETDLSLTYTRFNHTEQRDDRVLLFADWMPAGTYRHTYLARATTRGSFFAPPTQVSEMYHPTVFGLASAHQLDIR